MSGKPTVSSLSFYPVKSCSAVGLPSLYVGAHGFVSGKIGDRSWMVVDDKGVLVSQRENPTLARVKVGLLYDDNGNAHKIHLSVGGRDSIILDPDAVGDSRQKVIIHGGESVAHKAPDEVSQWFGAFLGKSVTLVHQKESDLRLCDARFAVNPEFDAVSFGDGFPYLVTNLATLEKLNGILENPVPMNRFRPNIVIGNAEPEAEYTWKSIAIGSAALALVKPCTRCVVTTIDQDAGVKTGKQPLSTLAATNLIAQNVGATRVQGAVFGENAIPTICGQISVGDAVSILEEKPIYNFIRRELKRAPG